MNIAFAITIVCLSTLSVFGQTTKGAYISHDRSGCKVWAEYYSKTVSVSWSGKCKNNLANGVGTLIWYDNGVETVRYTGNLDKGRPEGKGKYVWSNGYTQQGNYFQGEYLNLDSIYLKRLEKNILPIVDNGNIYVNDADAQTLFYYALVPPGKPNGALILLSGSSENASSVFTNNVQLIQRVNDLGIVILVPSINNNLALGNDEVDFLNAAFENAVGKYGIPNDKIVIGGFSLGGLLALRYSEMSYDTNYKTAVVPLAVFAADPPVDLARLYEIFQREVERNTSETSVAACKHYIDAMETNFGGEPRLHPEKYTTFSAYSRTERDGGNAKFLTSIPVRIYSDPDIDWQMKMRKGDYYDMGALDQTSMINLLNRLGNTNAQFINALGKGHNPDGSRNPHSWSIIDAGECIEWISKCLGLD
jgi:hypothetical protein